MAATSVLVPLRFIFLISNILLIVEIFSRNDCHVQSSLTLATTDPAYEQEVNISRKVDQTLGHEKTYINVQTFVFKIYW